MFEEKSKSAPLIFEEVLAQERAVIHSDKEDITTPSTALCLSGGGIRAATFALGVIQGLAEKGALDIFDYLSSALVGGTQVHGSLLGGKDGDGIAVCSS